MTETPHPLLPAATPVLRVDAEVLQVGGVDGRDGLRISPAGAELGALLRRLDGRRSQRAVRADAMAGGLPGDVVDDLLAGLRGAGLLHDLAAADVLATDAGPAAAARAGVELPAAVPGSRAGGRWRDRRQSAVVVEGADRVGTPLAAVLAASGVGRVHVRDRGTTRAGDAIVGGATAADEGRPRPSAAADAIRRASPLTDLRPLAPGQAPDLVVLCRPWAAVDPLSVAWHRAGVPHLVATVRGGNRGRRPVRGARRQQLPAMCGGLAPRRGPHLAAARRPARRGRTRPDRGDDHLPAHGADRGGAGARAPGRRPGSRHGRRHPRDAPARLRPPAAALVPAPRLRLCRSGPAR